MVFAFYILPAIMRRRKNKKTLPNHIRQSFLNVSISIQPQQPGGAPGMIIMLMIMLLNGYISSILVQ